MLAPTLLTRRLPESVRWTSAPDDAEAIVFPVLAVKRTSGKSGLSMAFVRIMEKANVHGRVLRKRQGKGRVAFVKRL